MYYLNDSERDYRHGTHGPKYLEKGPRMNFGMVRLLPGEVVSCHVHEYMQECFYVQNGTVTIQIEEEKVVLSVGDYIHLEPGEKHQLSNLGEEQVDMIVVASPYVENDKVMVEN